MSGELVRYWKEVVVAHRWCVLGIYVEELKKAI